MFNRFYEVVSEGKQSGTAVVKVYEKNSDGTISILGFLLFGSDGLTVIGKFDSAEEAAESEEDSSPGPR